MEFLFLSGLSVRLQELVKRPLTGLKVVCYYGCLLVRPPDVEKNLIPAPPGCSGGP